MTEKEREILRSNASIQNFKRNSLIYCEGDEPTDMMCLLKGKVKIYKDGVGGRSQIIRMIKPVQYFGYRAHFAHENFFVVGSPTLVFWRVGRYRYINTANHITTRHGITAKIHRCCVSQFRCVSILHGTRITVLYKTQISYCHFRSKNILLRKVKMKIIVSIKQVPDTSGKVAVNPDGTLNRASMQTIS